MKRKHFKKSYSIPYRWQKSRGKVTQFFASDKIFPQPVFFPNFFSPDKEFIPILLLLLLFPIY